jgi:hypothetical protein
VRYKAGICVKLYILCGLENMIPWEKVINNDTVRTLPEREDFFKGRNGSWELQNNKSVVLNLISIQEVYNY